MLSGEKVRGPWRLDDHMHAVTLLGSAQLDLCDAQVVGDEATIYVVAVFGGVEVQVPEGLPVEAQRHRDHGHQAVQGEEM